MAGRCHGRGTRSREFSGDGAAGGNGFGYSRRCRNGQLLSPLLGVFQNDTAPMIIDNPPFFDLLQGSKAAEAGKVIV
jgi:hypothetical protein